MEYLVFISLMEESGLSNEQTEYMSYIKHTTESLMALLNDILYLTNIEAGIITISKDEFDFRQFVEEIVENHRAKAKVKGLEIYLDINDAIPKKLIGDYVKFGQVISNITNNAIKFTQKGSIKIVISNTYNDIGIAEVLVSIEDTGIGVDKKDMDKNF